MKPRTQLEKRVEALSATLKGLTSSQEKWGFDNVIPHYGIYKIKTMECCCVDCGHSWTGKKPKRCPSCGAKLTLVTNSRQMRFSDGKYYVILQKVKEFNVLRQFYLYYNKKRGEPSSVRYAVEVVQHWIDDTGHDTIRAKNLAMFPYYRSCPFCLDTNLSLKRDYDRYGYNNAYYHIPPDGVYPRYSCRDKLKRNGFSGRFNGLYPERAISYLLSDNKFETLWKKGMMDFVKKYFSSDKQRIAKYWKAVLDYDRYGYRVKDLSIWFDYLDLLDYFQKDLRSPHYLFPVDLAKEHDALVRKKQAILERIEIQHRKEKEMEKLAVLAEKSRYFDITFGNDLLFVVVLKTLEDYKHEGECQHHCVYTNSYYGKRDSLILSARMKEKPDQPVETIEVSLSDGHILQCYGRYNQPTKYHQAILDLVNNNSKQFISHGIS